jgi:hypothetical protein
MDKNTYMTFKTKKNGDVSMNKETFARWLCLMEAFYIINKKAEDLNINLNDDDVVKPLAFEKYIQQRYESMMLDLTHDEKNNLVGKNIINYNYKTEDESVVTTIS